MNLKKVLRLASLLILCVLSSCAQLGTQSESDPLIVTDHLKSNKSFTKMILSIKTTDQEQIEYDITIPPSFRHLGIHPYPKHFLFEYMPKEDQDPTYWSEIINLSISVVHGDPSVFIEKLKEDYFQTCSKEELHQIESFREVIEGCPVEYLFVDEKSLAFGPGHTGDEIPNISALSLRKLIEAKQGIVSIEYSIRYPTNTPKDEKERLRAKIRQLIDGCKIIRSKIPETPNTL